MNLGPNTFNANNIWPIFDCNYANTQTYTTQVSTRIPHREDLIAIHWSERLDRLERKQFARVRPEKVPYHRPPLPPQPFHRVGGRGMFVRRVKPLNRRNAHRR